MLDTEEHLELYCLVRIVKLLRPSDQYDPWQLNVSCPQIGNIGTLVDTLEAPNLSRKFIVESCDSQGYTIWLSEFDAEELQKLDEPYTFSDRFGMQGR